MNRKKIIYVPSWWPSPENMQAGNFFQDHARIISRRHSLIVLLPAVRPFRFGTQSSCRIYHEGEVAVVHSSRATVFPGGEVGARLARRLAFENAIISGVKHLGGVDVIHAQHVDPAGVLAVAWGKRHKIPVVLSEHASFVERYLKDKSYQHVRTAFHEADVITAPSHFLANLMQSCGLAEKIQILPNPYDCQFQLDRLSVHTKAGPPWRLLSIGNLTDVKGFDVLLEALKLLSGLGVNFKCEIVGEGESRQKLEAQIRDLQLSGMIQLTGRLERQEIIKKLRISHIYLNCSRRETFGIAIIEALASGLPVICTRCGGPEEFVTPINGVLVPRDDPNLFSSAIQHVIVNWGRFSKESVVGSVAAFSESAYLARISEIYDALFNVAGGNKC